MAFTRRQWIGSTAAGAAGLAATSYGLSPITQALAQEAAVAPEAALAALKKFTGTVAHADHYGPCIATVKNGRLTEVTPTAADKRPTPMLTEGMLERTYDKTRIAGPMVRKSYLEAVQNGGSSKPELRGKDGWVEVSWDTAIGLTAKAILDTIEKHGNEGCFSSSYGGWSHAGIFRPNVLQGRFFNLLGGSSMTAGDYSAGAGQVIMPMIIGDLEVYSAQTSWEQVRDNTEVFVFVGCDPDKNNRVEYTVCDHEMYANFDAIKKAGVKFISINPQVTTTDEQMGSQWVKIIPNTDTALFLAMSYHLYRTGKHNKTFISKYTVGFDRFLAYLEGKDADGSPPKTPEWASKITGIPAAQIRELAELMASKRTQIAGSWAIQRAHHGEMPYWAIV
ncbi:MAG: molybdopterin-dependent oxidoreductase, partial [Rhodoferax sp.]